MHNEYDLSRLLMEAYIKVVCVNLTEDTFEEIKLPDAERDPSQGYADTVSEWWERFAEVGNVLAEDQERYGVFMRLDSLRRAFASGRESISILYRRRTLKGDYHWVRTTFCRSYNYTDDQQIVMAYIEDVNEEIQMTQDILSQQRITEALVDMYFLCVYVDLDDYTYERIHVDPAIRDLVPLTGTMSEFISVNVNQVIVPHDPQGLMQSFSPEVFRKELVNQRCYDYEYRASTTGDEIICRIVAIRVDRHPDQTPRHVIIAMQDVTAIADKAR